MQVGIHFGIERTTVVVIDPREKQEPKEIITVENKVSCTRIDIPLCIDYIDGMTYDVSCPRPFLGSSFTMYGKNGRIKEKYRIAKDSNNNIVYFSCGRIVDKPKNVIESILRKVHEECIEKISGFNDANQVHVIGIPSDHSNSNMFMDLVKQEFSNICGYDESALAVLGYCYIHEDNSSVQSNSETQYFVFSFHELTFYDYCKVELITRVREKNVTSYKVKDMTFSSAVECLKSQKPNRHVIILTEGPSEGTVEAAIISVKEVCQNNGIPFYEQTKGVNLIAVGAAAWNGENIECDDSFSIKPKGNWGIFTMGKKVPFFTTNVKTKNTVKKEFKNSGNFTQIDFCLYDDHSVEEYRIENLRGNKEERFFIKMKLSNGKPDISVFPSQMEREINKMACHKLYQSN